MTRTTVSEQMTQVQRELGAIGEALKNTAGFRMEVLDRLDRHAEKMDRMSGELRNVQQSLTSQSTVIDALSRKDYDLRIARLEEITRGLPALETEITFWRRLLGGGIHAVWKIAAALVGSGVVGALFTKYINQ